MVFHVVAIAAGLAEEDHTRAVEVAPAHAATEVGYPELLAVAGFRDIQEDDITEAYLLTATRWRDQCAAAAEQMKQVFGADEFRDAQLQRTETVAAIEGGLLERYEYSARAG